MAVYTTKHFLNRDMPTSTNSGQLLAYRVAFTFAAAVTLALNDVIRLAVLPPNFSLVGVDIDNDALGTACVGNVGVLNTAETATIANAIALCPLAAAGFTVTNNAAARRLAIDPDTPQTVGIVISTAASAALAAGATVGAIIYYRAKQSVE